MIVLTLAMMLPDYGMQRMQRVDTIECESYDYVNGGIVFYRMRYNDNLHNPNDYYGSFFIPTHLIVWMSRSFGPGVKLPNYNTETIS